MLLASGAPRHRAGWIAQPKLDGWRAQVAVNDAGVRVWSRNGHRLNVPELDALSQLLGGRRVTLDGELVVMAGAVGDFEALCQRMMRGPERSAHHAGFLAFDVLELDGVAMTGMPWETRQEALDALNLRSCSVGTVPVLRDVDDAWRRAQADGWEGVVYKRTASRWRAGERSNDWRKRKVWKRGTVHVTGYREVGGIVDKVSILIDADGSPQRRGVIEHPGSAVSTRLVEADATPADRRGWRAVDSPLPLIVQYRTGPSGVVREPMVIGVG